jgi:hypothetical protein
MDYGKVLSRAWQITWRWKVLWILGFLASLGSGGGGGGGGSYTTGDGQGFEGGPWSGPSLGPEFWAPVAGIILGLVCLGLIIAIALWIISIIARGGLIAGVQQIEEEGDTSFGQAWRAGASRFWTLFGIAVLTALPFLILGIILAGLAVVGILAAMGAANGFESIALTGIATAIVCGVGFCCLLVILGIVLDQIRTYAERAAILEGLGWIDAFVRGWRVIVENLGPTIIVWLIIFAIGLVLVAGIFAGIVALLLPIGVGIAAFEPGLWLIAPACCGGLVVIILLALLSAIVQTFTSATWTLTYRELTGAVSEAELEPAFEG